MHFYLFIYLHISTSEAGTIFLIEHSLYTHLCHFFTLFVPNAKRKEKKTHKNTIYSYMAGQLCDAGI